MIEQELRREAHAPIRQLCQSLQVNRAWWYEHRKQTETSEEEIALRDEIELIVLEFPGYGYRRVTRALKRQGWNVNHKHVLRVMQEEALLCQVKKQFVPTTDSQHGYAVYENLLKTANPTAPNQAWVADVRHVGANGIPVEAGEDESKVL